MRKHVLAFAFSLVIISVSLYVTSSSSSPPLPRIPHINDETRYALHNQSMENTLMVVPTNAGMLHWVENLLCSLKKTSMDVTKIVFWTLDLEAKAVLEKKGYTTYHDPLFYSVSTNENFDGNTGSYKRMMLERPKFFIDILSMGLDILFVDADTIFFQSPLLIRDTAVEAVFSTDSREFYETHNAFLDSWRRGTLIPPVCNGLFWMKSNEKTIKLWQDMLHVFQSSGWMTAIFRLISFQDDQRGMDVLLNDGRAALVEPFPRGIIPDMLDGKYSMERELNVRLLDQTMFVNGHLLKNRRTEYEQYLTELRSRGEDRIAVHLNWNTKQMTKEEGARKMEFWLLDEEGNCKT